MNEIRNLLFTYEIISGQKDNYHKSEICLSRNVAADMRSYVCDTLNVKQVQNNGRYLGMPFVFGQDRCKAFRNIIEKLWSRSSWCSKSLSIAGKEILAKTVLRALPTYLMSCFHLPDSD